MARTTPLEQIHLDAGRAMGQVDGVRTPQVCSSLEREVAAIRSSVALTDLSSTTIFRLQGDDAQGFIDRLCPCFLNLKPNQMKHTVLLNDSAHPLADVYISREAEGYLVFAGGVPATELAAWFRSHAGPSDALQILRLNDDHALIALNGPFAWELLAEWDDPEVISLPYRSFYRTRAGHLVFRAGETGEFGYRVMTRTDETRTVWEELIGHGLAFDAEVAGTAALDHCALENMFFNIHKEGAVPATPAELQLQWRVSYRKDFVYAAALRRTRELPLVRRLTALAAGAPFASGDAVVAQDTPIGTVVNAAPFLSGTGHIGLAMLDMPWASSGIPHYHVRTRNGPVPVRTVSPPFVNNRSLYVDPQVHAYVERDTIRFPKLASDEP